MYYTCVPLHVVNSSTGVWTWISRDDGVTCLYMLAVSCASHCKSQYLRLTSLTDGAFLSFGKKLKEKKTQLSVMGMSLRIGMWSPISLTLKPRVGITLIAASRDSLNPSVVSLGGFFFWQLSGRLLRLQKHSARHISWPTKNWKAVPILWKSILITFLWTHLSEKLDLLQVSEAPVDSLENVLDAAQGEFEQVSLCSLNLLFRSSGWQIETHEQGVDNDSPFSPLS